jgi:predicted dinucleotide-binding enzyme
MQNKKIGIIGSGRLGTSLARLLSSTGYDVSIINSQGVDSLALQLKILLPNVKAKEVDKLIDESDIIILALPLRNYTSLPLSKFTGKVVVDAMNYWAAIDGAIPEFENYAGSSSERVAESLPDALVVKTMNSVAYNELEEHSLPSGAPNRRGMPLAGDSADAKAIVSELIDAIGFDVVDLGPLTSGKLFQPDTNLFNKRLTKEQIASG